MPYQFGMGAFEGPTKDDTGSFTVNFALGYDADIYVAVLMSVMLVNGDSYLQGKLTSVFDLQFGIRLLDLNSGLASAPIFDHAAAGPYIPKDQGPSVLMRVIDACGLLVGAAKPSHITMETYHGRLPQKALYKYWLISGYFADSHAFRIFDHFRDGTSGVNYWFYSLQAI